MQVCTSLQYLHCISMPVPCVCQITMPVPHHSVFYRPDALPAAQPTASKHWRDISNHSKQCKFTSVHYYIKQTSKRRQKKIHQKLSSHRSVTYIDVTATVMSVSDLSLTGALTSSFKALEDTCVSVTASQEAGETSEDTTEYPSSLGTGSSDSWTSAAITKQKNPLLTDHRVTTYYGCISQPPRTFCRRIALT